MNELLFLAHRIPFPPNKGDKIRSFHILQHLSKSYRVHLGTFVDDPYDWRYEQDIRRYCDQLCILPLVPLRSKLNSVKGFFTNSALSLPYYYDARMKAWVDSLIGERSIKNVMVFSSAMAQYVEDKDCCNRIIDFVDVDSDKWRQYAAKKTWPASWIYAREGEKLLAFDRRIAQSFDRSLFVSSEESSLFKRLAPESAHKIEALENGVNDTYFNDKGNFINPYSADDDVVVFTGAMDYWANIDAVVWFAVKVFPLLRKDNKIIKFYIVGTRPAKEVIALGQTEGVVVTGAVEDIRPYLAYARLAVAPLRIARGVQNKVLEAMAMGKSIIASPPAMEGIEVSGDLDISVADHPDEWRRIMLSAQEKDLMPRYSIRNRNFILERYGWDRNLRSLDDLWR
jgi:sugar transferase (PEP-CTERM/EpsH1 system associated)